MRRLAFIAALLPIFHATPSAAAPLVNLLSNGSFETGNFNDWTLNASDSEVLNQSYDGFSAQSGADYALLGPVGSDGTLTQAITDTTGETLTLSFWLASDGGLPNDFHAIFDAVTVFSQTSIPAQGWTLYTATVNATGADQLSFAFRNDPGYMALDNVSITAAAVPEPASWAMIGVGLLVAARARTTRKKTLRS